MENRVEKLLLIVVGRHGAVHERIERAADALVGIVECFRIVSIARGAVLLDGAAEDVVVLPSGLTDDLDVCAVHRAERHRAVEHELHIARAGGLRTRRGDLLGDIRRGNDHFGIGAVVVLHKHDAHFSVYVGVVVHKLGQAVDIPDDGFCAAVAGRGFRAENERRGRHIGKAAVLDLKIEVGKAQSVHQLALILVRTLDLHVEHKFLGNVHALGFADVRGEPALFLELDGVEEHGELVVHMLAQIPDAVKIAQEPFADFRADKLGKLRVAEPQPAARRDAVRDVNDAARVFLVPRAEKVVPEDLAVDLRNAVHLTGHIHRKIGHARLIIANDMEIFAGELLLQPLLDLHENIADLRYDAAQKVHIPALERLAHNGVVRIGEHAARDVKGTVKADALGREQADELGNGHGGVRVVELHGDKFAEAVQIAVAVSLVGTQNVLQ